MGAIPRPALLLGLAGLIPFLYAALATLAPAVALPAAPPGTVYELYGVIIFAYMAGVFWGYAAAAAQEGLWWYGVAVLPAVLVFLAILAAPGAAQGILLIAFPALLLVDRAFHAAGLAPVWWMRLRLLLTSIVTATLLVGLLG